MACSGSLILGLVNSFSGSPPGPHPASRGLRGSRSRLLQPMEARHEGIVIQAVLATLATFGAILPPTPTAASGSGQVPPGGGRGTLGYGSSPHQPRPVDDRCGRRGLGTALHDHHDHHGDPAGRPARDSCGLPQTAFLAIDFESTETGCATGCSAPRLGGASAWSSPSWLYVEFLRLLIYFRD